MTTLEWEPAPISSVPSVARTVHSICRGRGQPLRIGRLYLGPHKIMWATDYPHSDGFFPEAPEMIRERLEPLSPDARHQVMAGGAMGFYGLH